MLLRFSAAMILGVCLVGGALSQPADEYQVKAAFLYNFVKFVEWPPQTFGSEKDAIVICVLGDTPLAHAMEESIAGKMILGRRLVIKRIADVKEASLCQVLFVSGSEGKRVQSILDDLAATGVLTVGERQGFAAQGGVINFRIDDGRVRFEINVAAAAQQRLHISSKLLSLAQIVKN